ncbi:hypothetical protein V6C27_01485 [Peptococcaceae bacterium 1198_IL3148]
MKKYKIVAINLGSTSTKIAYYENDQCKLKTNLVHSAQELKQFDTIWDQYDYRLHVIENYLKENNIEVSELDAVATHGGHIEPIVGGVYRVNEKLLAQSASGKYGLHACDLGLKIVTALSQYGPVPLTVDPPITDEFEPLARYSVLPELPRRSSFHALNHRAVGKQYAKDIGKEAKPKCQKVVHYAEQPGFDIRKLVPVPTNTCLSYQELASE